MALQFEFVYKTFSCMSWSINQEPLGLLNLTAILFHSSSDNLLQDNYTIFPKKC